MGKKIDYKDYEVHYSKEDFFKKFLGQARKIGIKLGYPALLIYYTLEKEELPSHIRAIIIGALGYFILPIDLIPDAIPIIGYVDDLGLVIGALAMASLYIDYKVRAKAYKKLEDIFGPIDKTEFKNVNDYLDDQLKK